MIYIVIRYDNIIYKGDHFNEGVFSDLDEAIRFKEYQENHQSFFEVKYHTSWEIETMKIINGVW